MRRYCLEALTDPDGFRARCRRRYGTEHSHHDTTAREAVAAGTADAGECVTRGHHSREDHKAICLAPWRIPPVIDAALGVIEADETLDLRAAAHAISALSNIGDAIACGCELFPQSAVVSILAPGGVSAGYSPIVLGILRPVLENIGLEVPRNA